MAISQFGLFNYHWKYIYLMMSIIVTNKRSLMICTPSYIISLSWVIIQQPRQLLILLGFFQALSFQDDLIQFSMCWIGISFILKQFFTYITVSELLEIPKMREWFVNMDMLIMLFWSRSLFFLLEINFI